MTTSASLPRPQALGDATQKLVEEARTCDPEEGHAYQHDLIQRLADALEAAQRPPVGPEVREEMFRLLYDASGSQFMRSNERHSMVTEQRDAILARFSVPSRPPISPEVRDAIRAVVGEQLTKAGLDLNGPPYNDDGETRWPVALELRDRMTAAILARFSLPVLDAEKVARVIQIAANSSEDRSPGQTRAEWYAAALVAALRGGELTREEASE